MWYRYQYLTPQKADSIHAFLKVGALAHPGFSIIKVVSLAQFLYDNEDHRLLYCIHALLYLLLPFTSKNKLIRFPQKLLQLKSLTAMFLPVFNSAESARRL